MKWIITADRVSEAGTTFANKKIQANKQWMEAYRAACVEAKPHMLEGFKEAMTDEFQLFDGDDNLCYEGLCLNLDEQNGDNAFEPLDWAENEAGCTYMMTRKKGETTWTQL